LNLEGLENGLFSQRTPKEDSKGDDLTPETSRTK